MEDYIIDAAEWHSKGDPLSKTILIEHEMAYKPLLEFLRENKLMVNENFGKNLENWLLFELRVSDFNKQGNVLQERCFDKWVVSLDRIDVGEKTEEKVLKRISIWKKELEAIKKLHVNS